MKKEIRETVKKRIADNKVKLAQRYEITNKAKLPGYETKHLEEEIANDEEILRKLSWRHNPNKWVLRITVAVVIGVSGAVAHYILPKIFG